MCPNLQEVDCLELIELANRLCVQKLIMLSEAYIVEKLTQADEQDKDIVEDVIHLLESAQVKSKHNHYKSNMGHG